MRAAKPAANGTGPSAQHVAAKPRQAARWRVFSRRVGAATAAQRGDGVGRWGAGPWKGRGFAA